MKDEKANSEKGFSILENEKKTLTDEIDKLKAGSYFVNKK